ncbi:hypothetical protein D3C86_2216110 [compost metagenome]
MEQDRLDQLHARWIAEWRTQVDLIDKKLRHFDSEKDRDEARADYLEWIAYSLSFLARPRG